jgi:hypothetical protein
LKFGADGPDVLWPQRRLGSGQFPLVPRDALWVPIGMGFRCLAWSFSSFVRMTSMASIKLLTQADRCPLSGANRPREPIAFAAEDDPERSSDAHAHDRAYKAG